VIEGFEGRKKIRGLGGGERPSDEEEKENGEGDSGCETATADDHSRILVPADRPATNQFFGISVPQ
jgi:hypothetical protein